jgi:hypothetical protein
MKNALLIRQLDRAFDVRTPWSGMARQYRDAVGPWRAYLSALQ